MVRRGRVAADTSSMRASNVGLVLRHVWKTDGVSRVAIAGDTGLSRATVSDIVSDLLERGLIAETGAGTSSGGRRPIVLEVVADARHVVGLDFTRDQVEMVLLNLRGKVIMSTSTGFDVANDAQGAFEAAARLVQDAQAFLQDADTIIGVGAGVSTPLHGDRLHYVSGFSLPGWTGIDVVAGLQDRLGLPVVLENDANLLAIAAKVWGDGQELDDFTCIHLDVGVGAGHVVNGQLYRGASGAAGEIGHTPVALDGPLCRCGSTGCLEAFIGSERLVARHATLSPTPVATVDELAEAARGGDPVAMTVVEEAGRYLGLAISQLACLLNPARVILSGPITRSGDLLLAPVRDVMARHAFEPSIREAEVEISGSQHLTVAMGAAARVLEVGLLDGGSTWAPDTATFVTSGFPAREPAHPRHGKGPT